MLFGNPDGMQDAQVANERASAFEILVALCAIKLGMTQVNVSIWMCKRLVQKTPRHVMRVLAVFSVATQRLERMLTCTAVEIGVQGVRQKQHVSCVSHLHAMQIANMRSIAGFACVCLFADSAVVVGIIDIGLVGLASGCSFIKLLADSVHQGQVHLETVLGSHGFITRTAVKVGIVDIGS